MIAMSGLRVDVPVAETSSSVPVIGAVVTSAKAGAARQNAVSGSNRVFIASLLCPDSSINRTAPVMNIFVTLAKAGVHPDRRDAASSPEMDASFRWREATR